MGASASLLRAVVIAPMEGSIVARYAVISPTARGFMVTEAAGIGFLGLGGDVQAAGLDVDGEASRARELSLLVGYEGSEEITSRPRAYLRAPRPHQLFFVAADEVSEVEILPRPRTCLLAPRPRLLSLLAADEGSEEELHPHTRACLLAPRPRLLSLITADKVPEVEILPRPRTYLLAPLPRARSLAADTASASEIPSPRALFLLAARSVADEVESSFLIAAMRPRDLAGSMQMVPARAFSVTATDPISFVTSLGARPRLFQPAIRTGYGPPGHHLFRPAGRPDSLRSMRFGELPSIQMIGRRNWCWTPWQPKNPNAVPTKASPPGFEDIVKVVNDRKLTNEEKAKLKELLLEKLYTEDEVPEAPEVKLDLILHGLKVINKSLKDLWAQAEKKPKKWRTLTILVTWISAIISLFR